MPHEDDIRVKRIIRDIGQIDDLKLRVFDRSSDDNRLWNDGGLTFTYQGLIYGSNDGAWYREIPWFIDGVKKSDQKPIIVVEGTFGPEVGNTGSAQYARFSHVLGAALNGIIAVYFIPHNAVYGNNHVKWRWDLVLACVNASKTCSGKILMIDAYFPEKLEELVKIFSEKNEERMKNIIHNHLYEMEKYAVHQFRLINESPYIGSKDLEIKDEEILLLANNKRRYYAYLSENSIGKIMMFNKRAFTDASQRNGHTILGDALLHRYLFRRNVDLIFPRFNDEDIIYLDSRNSKEWKILRTRQDINIITIDQIDFENQKLLKQIKEIRETRSIASLKNDLIIQLKEGIRNGSISINK